MNETKVLETSQYLTFNLGDEVFALEINKVREVLDFTNITKIPRTPDFMKGVINLRGNVVPVIDLRLNLGMDAIERTVDTCIVIVEVDMDGDTLHIGALADSVQEVVGIDAEQIEPAPRLGTQLNTDFIKGMGKRDETFVIILDIDRVLSVDDFSALKAASRMSAGDRTAEQDDEQAPQ